MKEIRECVICEKEFKTKASKNNKRKTCCKDCSIKYNKAYQNRPDIKAKNKAYRNRPDIKAKNKAYQNRPDIKAKKKAYQNRPDIKAKKKALYKAKAEIWKNMIDKKKLRSLQEKSKETLKEFEKKE